MNRKARARLAAKKKASRPDRFIEDGYSHWKFSKGTSGSSDSAPVDHSDPTLVADFDPSQPRDKSGEWTGGGGGSAGQSKSGQEGRSFESVKDADKWGAKEFGNWDSGLSKSENWAVDAYSGGGYENINMYLRGKTDSDFSAAPGKTRQVMEGLDSALAKGRAPEPLTTYRGVRSDPGDPHSLVKQLVEAAKSGGTFSDKAYVSSSLVGKVAEKQFSGSSRKDVERAIIKIGVPKGSHGAYTDVLDITGEAEWLMPRGSTFKVTGATKRDDGVWEISAHVHEVDKHG